MKRVLYLIVDQLAGHWEESVKIEETNYPPVNVKGYHELGLIPNFSYLIKNGLWVRRPWNRGKCDTSHGMKYLATGSYSDEGCYKQGKPWYLKVKEGFFEFAKRYYKEKIEIGVFSNSPWLARGYFYTPVSMHGLVSGHYSDETILKDHAFPWMEEVVPNWNLVHIYFPNMDSISNCPSYGKDSDPYSSKHSYMLFLDKLIGDIIRFLKERDLWDETYLVLASDHGYHLGCSVAAGMGVKTNNWCCDHPPPWDCEVWDFEKGKSTGIYSGGPRRITFILSGGALDKIYRGETIEEAEIIDVVPTIAQLLGIPYKCEGNSILNYRKSSD